MTSLAYREHLDSWAVDTWTDPTTVYTPSGCALGLNSKYTDVFPCHPLIPDECCDHSWDSNSMLFLVPRFDLESPVCGYMLTTHHCTLGTWVPCQWDHFLVRVWWQAHRRPSWQCFSPVLSRVWPLPPWGVRALQTPASALTNSDGTQQ